MRGRGRFSVWVAVVSAAMLLMGSIASGVYAENPGDGGQKHFVHKERGDYADHGKHGRHCGHHKWDMFKGLNLSAAQKEQVKGIMQGHRKEFAEGRIALLQARQKLMIATTANTFDQAAVQKASGDVAAAQEKMAILRAKVFSETMPILTPDQQTAVSGKLAQSKLRMQKEISKLESKRNPSAE